MASSASSAVVWLVVALIISTCVVSNAEYTLVPLPYALSDIAPPINNFTMQVHYFDGYGGGVNATNAVLASVNNSVIPPPSRNNLTRLITSARSLPASVSQQIRNFGGATWNHALYFLHLAPPGSEQTKQSSISPQLRTALVKSFGSVENAIGNISTAGASIFGSGWSWLCYTGRPKPLSILTTVNEDNPLSGNWPFTPRLALPAGVQRCTPILGLDMWEHSYFQQRGFNAGAYIDAFWTVVNWERVSYNFAAVVRGEPDAVVNPAIN